MLNPITSGRHRISNGFVDIGMYADGTASIDRIEVDADHRRLGEARKIIQIVAEAAIAQGMEVSAQVCPDDPAEEVTLGLRRVLGDAGFTPLEMDGEVYPNDLTLMKRG
jgi:GNAT superfamily N-acetyltransferase